MSNFLKKELGVAMSGVKWDIGNFKLWQSTDPNIILFTPKQPVLAKNANGRYQFGVTQFRQQVDDTYKITGGSGIFTITSAIQFTPEEFDTLTKQWKTEMLASQYRDKVPANPRFIPLNVRKGTAEVLINPVSGTPDEAHNNVEIGTPGGANSFLINLTELGAQEWVSGIKNQSIIPAGVKIMYEYLRMMPTIGATVKVHGRRFFRHISTDLNVKVGGRLFGGSAQISAAWEKMVRNGDVEITFIGNGLAPELEEIRQELVMTFADQAREQMFKQLFEPAPEVEDAKAGNTRGLFGGANFAFKYRKEEEITDLELELRFEGWTWLKASMDADLTSLISSLDNSYINEVNAQISAPTSIVVDADPILESVNVSMSASEGFVPKSPFFGVEGGVKNYTVTSQNINDVEVSYLAKVNFAPSNWPIIETQGKAKIGQGGNTAVVKPSAWVGRHHIFLFHHNGQMIVPPSPQDYLVCNVSFEGPHLEHPIKDSAKISGFEPLQFSYPLSPDGRKGQAKFSAFGVVNGRFVISKQAQDISFDEEAVFILVSSDGNIELVSQASLAGESASRNDNSLATRLLTAGARPVIKDTTSENGSYPEGKTRPNSNGKPNGILIGHITKVKYYNDKTEVSIRTEDDKEHTIRLHDEEEAEPLRGCKNQKVEIEVSKNGYAESIAILM